jgi:prepilin-type N-terminal cleavage/methylation domain-containing protein
MRATRTMTRLRDEGGFTLVELLVAAVIAAVGFLGLAATHTIAIKTTSVGRSTSIATRLASEQLEVMRRQPYAQVETIEEEDVTVGNRQFTRRATVGAAALGSAKKVTSTVQWTDQFGLHTMQLVTVIAE